MNKILFTIASFVLIFNCNLFAGTGDTLYVSSDSIRTQRYSLTEDILWRFHPGDNVDWALPDFDDSDWESISTFMDMQEFNIAKWPGIGWFRKVIKIDSTLINTSLGILIHHEGASEIYLNGKNIFCFGTVCDNNFDEEIYNPGYAPYVITLDTNIVYTLAVRYSNHRAAEWEYFYNKFFSHIGFSIELFNFNSDIESEVGHIKTMTSFLWGIISFSLAFSLIFFLLYFFYIKKKENLFFALFMLGVSLFYSAAALQEIRQMPLELIAMFRLMQFAGVSLTFISLLLFLYQIVNNRIIKLFWIFLTAFLIVNLVSFFGSEGIFDYMKPLMIVVFLLLIESTRVMIIGVIRKIRYIWILAIGGLIFVLLFISNTILSSIIEMGEPPTDLLILLNVLTFICLPVSMAIYLAKSYAQTNLDLEKQIITVKDLSAKKIEQERKNAELQLQAELDKKDNERKTKELEEARKLQLSMLPKKLPELSHLDIAVYMKTATEVGGDFYDFHVGQDNTLTVLVGDATGHGMNAGTMVTATKSMFQILAELPDLEYMFHQFNKSIFTMNLQPLLMALTLLRINENHLEIISGGMPELLIYRKENDSVYEIESSGPPLGAFTDIKYEVYRTEIVSGDVILALTDGFSERFNEKGEMIGCDTCKNIFNMNAGLSTKDIINQFVDIGEKWGGTKSQEDDITFVVIKCNNI